MNASRDFAALADAVLACDGVSAETRAWWASRLMAIKLRSAFGLSG